MVKGITQNKPVSEVGGFQASIVPPNTISSVEQAMHCFTLPSTVIPLGTPHVAFSDSSRPTPTLVGKRQDVEAVLPSRKRMGVASTGTSEKEEKEGKGVEKEKVKREAGVGDDLQTADVLQRADPNLPILAKRKRGRPRKENASASGTTVADGMTEDGMTEKKMKVAE